MADQDNSLTESNPYAAFQQPAAGYVAPAPAPVTTTPAAPAPAVSAVADPYAAFQKPTAPAPTDLPDNTSTGGPPKGVAASLWSQVKSTPGEIWDMLKTVTPHLETVNDIEDKRHLDSIKAGMHDIATHVGNGEFGKAADVIGRAIVPNYDTVSDQAKAGDIGGAAATTVGTLAKLYLLSKFGKAGAGAVKEAGAADALAGTPGTITNPATTLTNPLSDAVKVAKGTAAAPPVPDLLNAYGPSDVRFNERAPAAIADIKQHAPAPVTSNEHLSLTSPEQMVQPALDANRAAWDKWMQPAAQRGVVAQGTPIVTATEDALKSSVTPTQRKSILAEATSRFDRPIPVTELQEMLNEKNGELSGYYSKSPAARSAAEQAGAITGRTQSLLEAQAQKIRDLLYNALDPDNAGAGPREIQRRYGGIKMLANEADAARNTALGQTAGTPVGKAAKIAASVLDIPGKAMQGKLEEGLVAPGEVAHGKINSLVKRAFSNAPEFTPYPEPPASPRVAGLLNAPPVVTPPPADTSYVTGQTAAPAFRVGFPAGSPAQLPAATSTVGVSGTIVPDIIGRSSRGSGSPQAMLPAPNPQAPQPVTVPGRPGGVMPSSGYDIIAPGTREYLRPIGDVTRGQSILASPLGQTPATSDLQGVSRIPTEGAISPTSVRVMKSTADKMVVGQPVTLKNSSGQSITLIKLQDGKVYPYDPAAAARRPAR